MGELPVYYPNDEEVYFRCADMADGRVFCAVFNIGLDPIEKLELVCDFEATGFERLMPDGSCSAVGFERFGDRYILDIPCATLDPVVLFIEK